MIGDRFHGVRVKIGVQAVGTGDSVTGYPLKTTGHVQTPLKIELFLSSEQQWLTESLRVPGQ